jgi:hypothetical protein
MDSKQRLEAAAYAVGYVPVDGWWMADLADANNDTVPEGWYGVWGMEEGGPVECLGRAETADAAFAAAAQYLEWYQNNDIND